MTLLTSHSFFFLRHGETEANSADRIAGSLDSALTPKGFAQAEAAALILSRHPIAAIYHSPLSRARLTAAAVARQINVPMVSLVGLAERHWGGWEGQPRSVLRRDETPPDGGEVPEVFHARIKAALAEISGPHPVLIVAHSGTAREIHRLLSAQPFERLDNCQPIQWQYHHDGQGACHWNFSKLSQDRCEV